MWFFKKKKLLKEIKAIADASSKENTDKLYIQAKEYYPVIIEQIKESASQGNYELAIYYDELPNATYEFLKILQTLIENDGFNVTISGKNYLNLNISWGKKQIINTGNWAG